LNYKYLANEEIINSAKGFKPGTTDYDRMQARINKYENDVDLYKKII